MGTEAADGHERVEDLLAAYRFTDCDDQSVGFILPNRTPGTVRWLEP